MAKIHLTYQQILEHLDMIDSHLHMPYKEFEIPSFIYTSSGKNNIRDVALGMMLHVGLVGYEPIIKYENLGQHTGGHICLNNNLDRKVYITLSNDTEISKESELATLAHEICHKLLYTHNCYFPSMGDYNESLTDIATIYAGFGKLTINGCEITTSKTNYYRNQTTTTTRYTGYLDATQYIMSYKIVCLINNIDEKEYTYGIDRSKLDILYNNYQIRSIRDKGSELPEILRSSRLNRMTQDAILMRQTLFLESALSEIKNQIKQRQKNNVKFFDGIENEEGELSNPYLLLLKASAAVEQDKLQNDMQDILDACEESMGDFRYNNMIQSATLSMSCPVCGFTKENALKEHKKTLIRCPKCKRVFYWDASLPTKESTISQKNKTSLLNRIKSLFKRL